MLYRILEVWDCLGTSLENTGPGLSAWARYWERTPMEGSSAVASTSTPMPPSQWVKARHRRMPWGRDSMSVRMVARWW